MKISLFIPCFVDQAMPETGLAALRVLEKLGHEVQYDPRQTCCGQALFNAGFPNMAIPLAERFIRIFTPVETVVGVSGSCVAMIRHGYEELNLSGGYRRDWEKLRGRVFEFSEFLVDVLGVTDLGAHFPHRVAIHNSCHALRELGIARQPRALLSAVEGLTLVDPKTDDECCGFGGVFSAKFPELSNRIADRRSARLAAVEPEIVTGVDDACLQNLGEAFRRGGKAVRVMHIARILAGD